MEFVPEGAEHAVERGALVPVELGAHTVYVERHAEHFVFIEPGVSALAYFTFEEGAARLMGLRANRSLTAEQVGAIDWPRVFEDVLLQEAARTSFPSLEGLEGDRVEAITEAFTQAARNSVRPRKNNRWTAEFARQVVELHAAGGVDRLVDELHIDRRTAFRYVSRARKEGLLQ